MNGTVLVRPPSSRLAEGIVTHISRTPVDVALARAQHAAYADALAACGWMIRQAPAAEDCPDSVFIEDTVVVCEDLSKGGISFRSRNQYPVGTRVEVAVPFTPGTGAIFVPIRIVFSQAIPTAGLHRHGAAYIKPPSDN